MLAWCLFVGYAFFLGNAYWHGQQQAQVGERPLYTDFTPTYAASLLLRTLPAEMLYHPQAMRRAQVDAAYAIYPDITEKQARGVGFSAWQYPPSFIFVVLPLAILPYFPALVIWLVITAIPYLLAMRRILPAPYALPMTLAAPPTFYNLMYGQTGFLSAGLIVLGLLSLRSRPLLAGVLIGLASIKPHLGLLIPFALAAGGHWRAFGAAALTVSGLVLSSMVAFGMEPWYAFIGTLEFQWQGFEVGAYNYRPMTTLFATLRMAGASLSTSGIVQSVVTFLLLLLVMRVWHKQKNGAHATNLRYSLLCIATPLALPMAYIYDLTLTVPACAWLWRDMQAHGYRTWESASLLLSILGLLLSVPIARLFEVQIGAACLLIMLALVLIRLHPSWRICQ